MNKIIIFSALMVCIVFTAFWACNKTVNMPSAVPDLTTTYSYNKSTIHSPASNKLTDAGAALGRVLFYDKTLSLNNNVACASCHNQNNSFADVSALSNGFQGGKTRRNSLSILNESHKNEYFWDSREPILENMVVDPIKHKVEMGFVELSVLPNKLQNVKYYPDLFNKAFGTPEITQDRISKALAQFVRSLQSDNSKFDIGHKTGFTNFTSQELLGKDLFVNKFQCNNCHSMVSSAFIHIDTTGSDSTGGGSGYNTQLINANIGLDKSYTDNGVGELVGSFSNGMFRIPNLHNIGFTAPYMHDGRFTTLDQVIEHYSTGIQAHPNLSGQLMDNMGKPIKFNMTTDEKVALKAFLHTLDDQQFVTDPKFSNPFKAQ